MTTPIPLGAIPGARTTIAIQNGVERNILFKTWGGLGDELCAEPTLRYALQQFKDCDVSLAAERPELFEHLKFKRVFNLAEEQPRWEKYLCFNTVVPSSDIVWQFFSHCLTNCVDFPSLCALRMTLPIEFKELQCPVTETIQLPAIGPRVAIHAGRHWPSKTFPKDWWDRVIAGLVERGISPILIGAETDDNRGTVDVYTAGCVDLRGKLSIRGSIALLQAADVLLTNDSAPLHMAATGSKAWIGFMATCKHPDYITHWRNGQWGYRMQNLGLGGIWDLVNFCPNNKDEVTVDKVDVEILRSWLPEPASVAQWAVDKCQGGSNASSGTARISSGDTSAS